MCTDAGRRRRRPRWVLVCVCWSVLAGHMRGVCALYAHPRACVSYYVVDKREAGLEKMEKDERDDGLFSACSRELLEGSLPASVSFA